MEQPGKKAGFSDQFFVKRKNPAKLGFFLVLFRIWNNRVKIPIFSTSYFVTHLKLDDIYDQIPST
jgi:hypothetical protein